MSGINLYYDCCGHGDPVMVIHGGPGLDSTYLETTLKPLAEQLELCFYDQRCLGRSEGTPTPQTITINAFVHDIEVLREGLGLGKIHLLGHSWGCLLAMHYALRKPDCVRSLALVSPTAATYEGMLATDRRVLERFSPAELDVLSTLASSEPFLIGDQEAVNTFMNLWFRAYLSKRSDASPLHFQLVGQTAKNWARVNAYMLRHLGMFNMLPQLADISLPVTVIYGDEDVVPGYCIDELCAAIPNCRREVIAGSGHFPFLEKPAEFFNLLKAVLPPA